MGVVFRWCAPSLLACCTFHCSPCFAGCAWRPLNCTCCRGRYLRAVTPGGSISTSVDTLFLAWWWLCRQLLISEDTAQKRRKFRNVRSPWKSGGYYSLLFSADLCACVSFSGFRCWLRTDNYFIWSFLGPVAVIITVGVQVFISILELLCIFVKGRQCFCSCRCGHVGLSVVVTG